MVALQSFRRWAQVVKELTVPVVDVPRQRESLGRERWLDAAELSQFQAAVPSEWWPLFGLLVFTGLRIGEAQGLTWSDVRLAERVIHVRGPSRGNAVSKRRLKNESSDRDVPVSETIACEIARLGATIPAGSSDPVFPGDLGDYHCAYRVFKRVGRAAKLNDLRIHDLRHTFAMHWLLAGLPLVRLQKILGHATPAMTLRYMRHIPDQFFAQDAAKVAASLTGVESREATARAELARDSLKLA
jgi:integrase